MPIARFEMPDGRIGRFEVPEGTTPEQAQQLIGQFVSSQGAMEQPQASKDVESEDALSRMTGGVLTTGPGNPYLEAALQGLTLGFSDELQARAKSLFSKITGGDESYDEAAKGIRGAYSEFKEESPWTAGLLEAGGGLATGVVGGLKAGASAASMSPLWRGATYLGTGAAYGGLAGAGFAEQGETLEGAAKGAAIGAGTGLALPAVTALATRAAKPALDRLLGRAATRVKRQVERDIQNAGMTMDEAADELRKLGPNATLADLSDTLRARAEMVSQLPGPGREMSKVFETRNEAAGTRIGGALDNLFGGRVKLVDAVDDIVARTEQQATPLFQQAYQRFDNLPAYKMVKSSPGLTSGPPKKEVINPGLNKLLGSNMVKDAIARVNNRYASAGAGRTITPENMGLRDWHEVRKVLDDVAYGRIKESVMGKPIGDTAIARNLRSRLTSELNTLTKDQQTGRSLFEEANKVYSGQAQAMEAIELGQKFWTKSPDLIRKELSKMSKSEQDAYRLAALQKLYDKASDTTAGGNVYSRLFNSPGKRDRIKAILQDEDTFKEFEQLMKSEAAFGETFKATRTGSQTARRMLAAEESGIDPGLAVDVATGRPVSAAMGFARNALSGLRKPSEAERRELSRLLMGQGPSAQNALAEIATRPQGFYENPLVRAQFGGASAALSGQLGGRF